MSRAIHTAATAAEEIGAEQQQMGFMEPQRLSAGEVVGDPTDTRFITGSDPTAVENSIPMSAKVSRKTDQIRILLINPNATHSMTASCVSSVLPTLPPDVSITPFTGPSNDAPTAIEGQVDAILSSAACFRSLIAQSDLIATHDAILVACYSAHPLINMLREEFDLPVIGIMESSLLVSRTLGSKFGIVATSGRSAIAHWSNVAYYNMTPYCAGIESCDLGVLDLERLPREEVMKILQDVSRKLISQGAEVLCLGCAGMTEMKLALEEVVSQEGVQVVDGVVAGVHHLIGIVRMGGRTGKKGVWRSSVDGRKRRGQEYV